MRGSVKKVKGPTANFADVVADFFFDFFRMLLLLLSNLVRNRGRG